MPKITKHGGPTNALEPLSVMYREKGIVNDSLPPVTKLSIPVGVGIGIKEEESSVGNNSSLSSERTPTIEELLGIDPQ